jgi:hypothetical protein
MTASFHGEGCLAHTPKLTPPLVIEVPVPNQGGTRSCIRGNDFSSFYYFDMSFWNSLWYVLFLILFHIYGELTFFLYFYPYAYYLYPKSIAMLYKAVNHILTGKSHHM